MESLSLLISISILFIKEIKTKTQLNGHHILPETAILKLDEIKGLMETKNDN